MAKPPIGHFVADEQAQGVCSTFLNAVNRTRLVNMSLRNIEIGVYTGVRYNRGYFPILRLLPSLANPHLTVAPMHNMFRPQSLDIREGEASVATLRYRTEG